MKLNFPSYRLQIKTEKNKNYVFDRIRRKYVRLSPEEWVRQHLIHYLEELGYPLVRMSVERRLPGSNKRYDLLIHNEDGSPFLLAECKAPQVGIDVKSLDQLNGYILAQTVPFAILTDGLNHHFFRSEQDQVKNYPQIPHFSALNR